MTIVSMMVILPYSQFITNPAAEITNAVILRVKRAGIGQNSNRTTAVGDREFAYDPGGATLEFNTPGAVPGGEEIFVKFKY